MKDASESTCWASPLQPCSTDPVTGFFRDGCCNTGPMDRGLHTVCAPMTAEFLALSKYLGNDLVHPPPRSTAFRPQARRPVVPLRLPVPAGA